MKCKRCNYELTRGLVVGTAIGILAMLVVVAIMFGAGCRQAKPADPQEFIDRRVPEIKRLIAECQEFHDIPRVVPVGHPVRRHQRMGVDAPAIPADHRGSSCAGRGHV
jgi:hypothetical protein